MESIPLSQTSHQTGQPSDSRLEQYVGFRLDSTNYAIPIMQVREIIVMRPVTPLPNVPAYVEGLINLRGMVVPLMNLRRRFGLPAQEPDEETRTIVLTSGGRTFGCIVDVVTKVLKVSTEQLRTAPIAIQTGASRFISGLAQLDELHILLDLRHLLSDDENAIDGPERDSHWTA